jgi:5-methyltetrahydropteroyltriglutamate--homocysteine methyltransferase
MRRSTERILTTHTGSLPRPDALMRNLQRRDRGELDPADGALHAQVADAVAQIVHSQERAGVAVVNDGEAGKIGYSTYVKERLDGFGSEHVALDSRSPDIADFPEYMARAFSAVSLHLPACEGPVSYRGAAAVTEDIDNLHAALAGASVEEAFLTAASPGVIAVLLANRHYDDHESYVFALADAMKQEYDAIHEAGFLLQLDCPDLAMARHMLGDESLEEFRAIIAINVEALNHATRDIPPEAMRLHLCWGNYEGPHRHDVALADVIDIVLRARPAGISFEGANPRHEHEWTVFGERELPQDKVLIPGVIDSTTNYVEHPELVAQRIRRYADLVGRENVIAGTDCGFATFADLLHVDPAITWAKLEAMAQGAAIASAALW